MLSGRRVLIVDDEPDIRTLSMRAFLAAGCKCFQACDGLEALQVMNDVSIDLVIIDILMPGKEGNETIQEARRRWPSMKILAISGGGRAGAGDFLRLAQRLGADSVMSKPFALQSLIAEANRLIESA